VQLAGGCEEELIRPVVEMVGTVHCDTESAKRLMELCRDGRLYDVETWIREGKPVNVPSALRKSPLLIAVDRGFHSLVDLLLRSHADLYANGNALELAVKRGHYGIAQLLIKRGADPNSLSPRLVCCCGNLDIVRLFLDCGADLTRENGFAFGLVETKKALLGIYRSYRNRIPGLQRQADIALCHCCREGRIGGVCRLLWAGADPRARVPALEDEDDDPDMYGTSLEAAAFGGHYEILKRIGVDPFRDDLNDLLLSAGFSADPDIIRFLVEHGADINHRDSMGQTCLVRLLWAVHWHNDRIFSSGSYLEESRIKSALQTAIELGGKWQSGNGSATRLLRLAFYAENEGSLLSLLGTFRRHQACSDKELIRLLDTPRMLQKLSRDLKPFVKMFPEWRRAKERFDAEEERGRRLRLPNYR